MSRLQPTQRPAPKSPQRKAPPPQLTNLQRKLADDSIARQMPFTAGYTAIPHIWFTQPRDLPPFSFATIRAMLVDPEIRLNFSKRAAPLFGAEFGHKEGGQWVEGIECSRPEIGEFIYRQLQRIWTMFLPSILRSQIWGWSAGEITMRLSEAGLVEVNKLEPRHASDCRLLKQNNKRWGVAFARVNDAGTVNLPFPYCWFHSYGAEDGDDYGVSVALGAYSPWSDKWFNGGALDVRRLFMHKDAYGGTDLGYPDGETYIGNQFVPNRDIAQQIVQQLVAGGVTTRPSARDENGNEKWPLTRATVASNPQHILQYPKDLDQEIRHGMEVPEEDDSGAWAGKRIEMASFYASLDQWIVQIICDLREQVFDPLCLLNFGVVPEYEICAKPLAEQAMEQQSNAGPGGEGQPGMMGGDDPLGMGAQQGAPGMPPQMPQQPQQPQMMSLSDIGAHQTPIEALLGSAKRIARMSIDPAELEDKSDEPSKGEGYEYTAERIELMAELLAAAYGDQAEAMLDKALGNKPQKMGVWNPSDHPRGPNGRFIPKGTEEAYTLAKDKLHEAHQSRSPEAMTTLMEHMSTLTVAQLHKLKKEYGAKASAKTKAALVKKLTERLTGTEKPKGTRPDGTPQAPELRHVYTVPTGSLSVDPKRFQYKVKGIGEKGVGEELKGTSKWNPELGGVLLVWRDPENGKDYVVNGHHRHELATRANAEELNVRYIDTTNAKIARAHGALVNIAEGRGTAIDAAKYLRDSDRGIDHLREAGISLSGKVASDASHLLHLSSKAFQHVTEGRIDEDKAVAVAKHLHDAELQDKLFKRLEDREEDGKDWSLREIETAAKKMANAGKYKEQGTDLFGDFEEEHSTFDQEVELEAYISKQLGQEANDFGAVANTRRAERVSEAGNSLAVDENARRRDTAREHFEAFEREAALRGEVSSAIKQHAAELAKAKNRKARDEIKKAAFTEIRKLLAGSAEVEPMGAAA